MIPAWVQTNNRTRFQIYLGAVRKDGAFLYPEKFPLDNYFAIIQLMAGGCVALIGVITGASSFRSFRLTGKGSASPWERY